MAAIFYKAPEVLHWLDQGGKASMASGKKMAKETAQKAGEKTITDTLKRAAQAARSFGKGAIADFAYRQLDETTYSLYDDSFEAPTPTGLKKIAYSAVRAIRAEKGDRYQLEYEGGVHTIKPIAHLVAGNVKVPIGWKRSGMEVPYAMLIEEIAARSGVEITNE